MDNWWHNCQGVKWLGREAFHSPPPSDDMKNAGNPTSTIPYPFMHAQRQLYIRLQEQQFVTIKEHFFSSNLEDNLNKQ
jgi:hypothetical protein